MTIEHHYNAVSAAWQIIMGSNQHYGLYKTGKESLEQASQNLIDVMLQDETLSKHNKILDVGCGTGGPAFYLHNTYQVNITGIALSAQEIAQANKANVLNHSTEHITFLQADGQDNRLPSDTFDYVLMMESALLVPDKQKLFSENFRVLKPGGAFILCDQTKKKNLSPAQMYRYGIQLEALQASFGLTKTETLESYAALMQQAGFTDIRFDDVGESVRFSPLAWKKSCIEKAEDVLKHISQTQFDQFILACDTLAEFIDKEILSYGIVKGRKSSTQS